MSNSISSATLSVAASATSNRADSSDGVNVEGNKISWPDDGWYEVQSASSYNTMSQGGRSATMPNGVYTVINHTTGERFEGVEVGGGGQSDIELAQRTDRPLGLPSAIELTKNPDIPIYDLNSGYWDRPNAWGVTATPEGHIHDIDRGVGSSAGNSDLDVDGNQGGVSSAESAENGRFGTNEEGEFGGTPTAPAAEPVSQPTTTQRPNGNDLGSGSTDSSSNGGGVSSSKSAADGGFGTSAGGEFG